MKPRRPRLARPRRTHSHFSASLRKLEQQKARADAENAYADKLVDERQDGSGQGKGRRAEAEGRHQGRGCGDPAGRRQGGRAAEARRGGCDQGCRQGGRDQESRKRSKPRLDAKLAMEPVSVYISRSTQKLYVRRNTHKPAPDGGGEVFDTSIEVPVTIRDPGRPIGTHIFTAMAKQRRGPALERGQRSTMPTTPRTRSTASPFRRMCSIASRRPPCRAPRSSSRTSR